MTPKIKKKAKKGKRVLIIEDEPALSEIFSTRLEMGGYDVIIANDGVDGVHKALNDHPDLILCDVMMPQKDGFAVLKDLKENAKTKDIPVVMLTNLSQDYEIKRGMALGALRYLTKANLSPDHLEQEVNQILGIADKK